MMIRRSALLIAMVAMLGLTFTPAALAGDLTDQQRKEAAGWGCGEDAGLPPGHCISPGTVSRWAHMVARGGTFQILVFNETGDFQTAEIATFKSSAAGRACPHDPESKDGHYWQPEGAPGLYVCHHQPG